MTDSHDVAPARYTRSAAESVCGVNAVAARVIEDNQCNPEVANIVSLIARETPLARNPRRFFFREIIAAYVDHKDGWVIDPYKNATEYFSAMADNDNGGEFCARPRIAA